MLFLLSLSLALTVVNASLPDDILNGFKNLTDCASCHALLVPLQELAFLGDDPFVQTFTTVCTTLKLADDDVCEGEISRTGPIIAHDLRTISTMGPSSTGICIALFGLCTPLPVHNLTVPFPKPPPSDPQTFTSTGKPPFQVVHLSDVHIDRNYTIGSDANCTKPICCRAFADHSGPITEPARPFGEHTCDSPTSLADSMLAAFEQLVPQAQFAIFTGDVVEGLSWLVDKPEVVNDLTAFDDQLAAKMEIPVYNAFGNHDSAPVNAFPRNTTPGASSQFVFDTQAAGWERWINATAADQVRHNSGSYAIVHPSSNLRLISVNTQYWYPQNFWILDSDTPQPDPNRVLAFIIAQLQAAEDAGQRAWLFGHIPAGHPDTMHDQSNYFDQIVQRYRNTIAALFYGHTHHDQFQIAYSDYANQSASTAVTVAHIGPALTPRSGNPAFKVYDVDPDTYEILDSRVYFTNTTTPQFETDPQWSLLYSARADYGPLVDTLGASDPLNATFYHRLTEVFESNDTAFQTYNARISRDFNVSPCTGDCKTTTICNLRAMRSQNNCAVVTPGFRLRRRSLNDADSMHTVEVECEGGAAALFRAMPSLAAENDAVLRLKLTNVLVPV